MKTRFVIGTVVAAALLCGCPKRPAGGARVVEKEQDAIVKTRTETLDNAAKKRAERSEKLKAMDATQLAGELAADAAKGREPFNSSAFREAVSRGEAAAPALAQAVGPDRNSLLALLAVRRMSASAYQTIEQPRRVIILIDALRSSNMFNTWGIPHLRWEEAAQAIVAEGQAAEKPLTELLSDTRPAPVWGGEEYAEYLRYKYRVKDYAWALLREIRQQKGEIPADPAQRDQLIDRWREAPPR